jgi:hypothetical protein
LFTHANPTSVVYAVLGTPRLAHREATRRASSLFLSFPDIPLACLKDPPFQTERQHLFRIHDVAGSNATICFAEPAGPHPAVSWQTLSCPAQHLHALKRGDAQLPPLGESDFEDESELWFTRVPLGLNSFLLLCWVPGGLIHFFFFAVSFLLFCCF